MRSNLHHFALGGGQRAVDQDFGCGEVCGWGTNVVLDGDVTTADGDTDPIGDLVSGGGSLRPSGRAQRFCAQVHHVFGSQT